MKKTILINVMVCLAIPLLAQISITSSHIPVSGDTFRVSLANFTTYDPGITGANYTWDFSGIDGTSQDIDSFISPLNTNIAYNFAFTNPMDQQHFATVATNNGIPMNVLSFLSISEVYDFYKTSSSKHTAVGFGASFNGLPLPVKYNPVDLIYTLPLYYLGSDNSDSEFGLPIPNMGYYGAWKHRENIVDGYGTIITPFGTFSRVRLKSKIQQTDTIYVDTIGTGFTFDRPDRFEYKWLTDARSIPILEIRTSVNFGNETIDEVRFRDFISPPLGVFEEKTNLLTLSAWPNPSNGNFCIAFEADRDKIIEITDNFGKLIYRKEISAVHGFQTIEFQQKLEQGIYIISLISESDILRKKMIISY